VYAGRSQATPVTAWLRIPLDYFHSATYAQYPDETHASIRRTFNTPSVHTALAPTRRQFCGYCGTHLTAWNEDDNHAADYLNVTLGSLLSESVDMLEAMNIVSASDSDTEALVKEDEVNEESHIPTSEDSMGGVEATPGTPQDVTNLRPSAMQNRGMPYFEEMVENSRLGRIKRQKGGHTSRDGRTTVEWEVVEIGGDDTTPMEAVEASDTDGGRTKRQKTGA
jgi:hypothetical protein